MHRFPGMQNFQVNATSTVAPSLPSLAQPTAVVHNTGAQPLQHIQANVAPATPADGPTPVSGNVATTPPSQQQQHQQQQQIHQATAHAHANMAAATAASVPTAAGGAGATTPPNPQQHQQQQQFQRLKVEDALSYLDQVKLQFGNQPQVYNDFLDIMKEFKSQSIDTPGVINRVSNLFKGHPDLIVGFNTFLPPGYKIEVQSNDITVHQPGQQTLQFRAGEEMIMPSATRPVTTSVATSTAGSGAGFHSVTARQENVTSTSHSAQTPQNQPVEFNHAINYVNKIKNRFHGQPEIYKSFLEILHTYQKEQRSGKAEPTGPGHKPLTETEVYAQVAKLFSSQDDLLNEFGQFLPDANGGGGILGAFEPGSLFSSQFGASRAFQAISSEVALGGMKNDHGATVKKQNFHPKGAPPMRPQQHLKRQGPAPVNQAKVRKAFKSSEVYENFLRCLTLFNNEVISRHELVQMIQPFLGRYPELMRWLKDFLGYKDGNSVEAVPHSATPKERVSSEFAMDIDFASCKKYGASYRALPKSYPQPKCSGRTALCREVLNDTWVSFPSWSEDNFGTSKKTQYEEYIYRVEDERFQLDIVLETNLASIRVLEAVQKKLQRMTNDEAAKFRLDNSLGGFSDVLHRKAIQRIYGDKANDIIDGLKKNPVVAVPLVLRRLKAKDEEWREAQRGFNKIWREQNEKYYLKSLDHQGINFKQNDVKQIRSKALLNEIESAFDERQEASQDGQPGHVTEPHLQFVYTDPDVLVDARDIIVHHMKRQGSLHKDDKRQIKQLLIHFLPDMFHKERGELSDDEQEPEPEDEADKENAKEREPLSRLRERPSKVKEEDKIKAEPMEAETKKEVDSDTLMKEENDEEDSIHDDVYTLFFANNNWYLFLRLHHLLCERLGKVRAHAQLIKEEEARCKKERKESTAIALRLKAPSSVEPEEYYAYFVEMVKNLLDGNMEATQYEDELREMFGINAYTAFTLDKIVQNIVRQVCNLFKVDALQCSYVQLQHLVTDELCEQIWTAYIEERPKDACGGPVTTAEQRAVPETAYQRRAELLINEENCFKIRLYKHECRMTFELLDTEQDSAVDDVQEVERWSDYIERYVTNESIDMSPELKDRLSSKPVFLPRNIRQRRWWKDDDDETDSKDGKKENCTKIPSDMSIIDNTECKFDVNQYKRVYVVNSSTYLYKRNALDRAKKSHRVVSLNRHDKLCSWSESWAEKHVTEEQQDEIADWFMGQINGLNENKTEKLKRVRENETPYYDHYRYYVTSPQKEEDKEIASHDV